MLMERRAKKQRKANGDLAQMTGGEATVATLKAHGIDLIFGLPGIQNDWLYNALYDAGDDIRVIHTRHEQGAAYMALGYALATGDVSVFNVVPGPGILNATAALATAYGLNAPVFCLTGQIPTNKIGKASGVLHEIPHTPEVLRGLTKWVDRANHPTDVPRKISEAFYQLQSGRPRPVALEIPMDVLAGTGEVTIDDVRQPFAPSVAVGAIEEAAKLLGEAQHPMIYVGSGAQNVSQEVTALAEILEAPVVGYRTGRGILDSRHYLSLTMPPSHEYWKKTDVVLAIGTHMRIPLQQWGTDSVTVIRIDVDADALNKIKQANLGIIARAEDALPLLLNTVEKYNRQRTSRKDELLAIKADWAERTAYLKPQMTYIKLIREMLGEDGIFVDELTQVGFASRIVMDVYKPRTFISTGYMGTLGYGFPTALGVKVAKPDVPVVSVAGDGGFMFGVQELATAVQHKIGLVIIIFNNDSYGNVQQMQKNKYDGRVIASDLVNPDFVKLAQAFGANGYRAETIEQLREALEQGFASDLPTIIEVPIGDTPSVDRFRRLGKIR